MNRSVANRLHRVMALVLLTLMALPAMAQEGGPSSTVELEARVFEIAGKLRCPTCVSESVADSSAAISVEMRRQIQSQLEAGASEREVLAFFQERYGDWILLEPPRRGVHLFVWWLPGIALVAGAGGLTLLMIRWTRASRSASGTEPLSDEERARVRSALGSDQETS